jgi:hypothetical protein
MTDDLDFIISPSTLATHFGFKKDYNPSHHISRYELPKTLIGYLLLTTCG